MGKLILISDFCMYDISMEISSFCDLLTTQLTEWISELSGGNIGHYLKGDFTCNKVSHSSASSMGSEIGQSK